MDFRFSPADLSNEPGSVSQQQLNPPPSLSQPQPQPQATSHPTHHILPPLQSHHISSSAPKGAFELSPDATHAAQNVRLPGSASHNGVFGYIAPYSAMVDNSSIPAFMQPGNIFNHPSIYPAAFSGPQSQPQVIAPAPMQGRLPDIRPMPTGGLNQSQSLPAQGFQGQMLAQQTTAGDHEAPPTHVVGSQGRRGILPSAPGRAAAVAGSSTTNSKSATVPTKDADGKFPCPYCSKTYLHAKHLKRHLLRRESGCQRRFRALANSTKILATVRICVFSVKTRSHGVIFSSDIFRSARSEEAIQLAHLIYHTLKPI